MTQFDVRQDRAYRRGLVLGLTMAEIMILLIFLLLMALAAALANRDARILVLSNESKVQTLVDLLQRTFPNARTEDELFKELVQAAEAAKAVSDYDGSIDTLLENAELGRIVQEFADKKRVADIREWLEMTLARTDLEKKSQWPPFINLSEAEGYFFESGSAELSPEFRSALETTTVNRLLQIINEYDVDVIEVIGHTDEVPMVGVSNLDRKLLPVLSGDEKVSELRMTDNAGLAIARAVSVVRVLKADTRLSGITILPLSGAQLIEPVDTLADGLSSGDDRSRRRIEIRVRQSTGQFTEGMSQAASGEKAE